MSSMNNLLYEGENKFNASSYGLTSQHPSMADTLQQANTSHKKGLPSTMKPSTRSFSSKYCYKILKYFNRLLLNY